jgi:hypothetical protein
MENSTRLKQALADRFSQQWMVTVVRFFEEFPILLKAQYERIERETSSRAPFPGLWKILGDELLFVVELGRHSEVCVHVQAFRDALAAWNKETRASRSTTRLLVKGAAWTAGFPVANALLQTGATGEDYVGPSMDAGFRITKLATPRRLALSVELAWLLLACNTSLRAHFEGRVLMKGVAEESGYPELWVEVESSSFQRLEDEMLGRSFQESPQRMKSLCQAFIEEFGVPRYLPFLPGDPRLGIEPEGFANELLAVKQFLRDEVYLVSEDVAPAVPAADITQEEQALLSQLEDQRPST